MLELDLLEDSGQLMGTLGYNVDLFKESTVMKIAQQFQVRMQSLELNKKLFLDILLPSKTDTPPAGTC